MCVCDRVCMCVCVCVYLSVCLSVCLWREGGGGGGGGILCLFTSIFPRSPGLQEMLRLAHSTASGKFSFFGVMSVPTKSQLQAEAPSSG